MFVFLTFHGLLFHGGPPPDQRARHFVPEDAGGPAHQGASGVLRAGQSAAVRGLGSAGQPGLREGGKHDPNTNSSGLKLTKMIVLNV